MGATMLRQALNLRQERTCKPGIALRHSPGTGKARCPEIGLYALRIGIHCGPVVAGIIGQRKFIYDLWGDTVNLASRMESHGVAGGINVSAAAFSELQQSYRFEARGLVSVKGKADQEMYLLLGRR